MAIVLHKLYMLPSPTSSSASDSCFHGWGDFITSNWESALHLTAWKPWAPGIVYFHSSPHLRGLNSKSEQGQLPRCSGEKQCQTGSAPGDGFGGLVTQSCPTLATPWTVAIAHQAPLSVRFPRQEYWNGFQASGDLGVNTSKNRCSCWN